MRWQAIYVWMQEHWNDWDEYGMSSTRYKRLIVNTKCNSLAIRTSLWIFLITRYTCTQPWTSWKVMSIRLCAIDWMVGEWQISVTHIPYLEVRWSPLNWRHPSKEWFHDIWHDGISGWVQWPWSNKVASFPWCLACSKMCIVLAISLERYVVWTYYLSMSLFFLTTLTLSSSNYLTLKGQERSCPSHNPLQHRHSIRK